MALLPVPPAPPGPPPAATSITPVSADQFDDLIKIQTSALTALTDIRNELVKSASAMAEMRLEALAAAGAAGTGAAEGAAKGGGGGGGMLSKLGGMMKGAGAAGLAGGLGIAAVLAGAGLAAGGVSLLLNTLAEPGLGKNIRTNVDELLAINSGNAKALQSLDLLAVFTSLGAGLAVFGVGAAVAGLSSALTDYFGVNDWADTIHDNVITLLSIADDAGGKLDTLGKAGAVTLALAGLGVGLAYFGAGSTIAGVSQALEKTMGVTDWADKVHDNVITLLSIADDAGGAIATLAKGGSVALALAGLGIGIGIFGAGSTVAGVSQALNKTMGQSDWAVKVHDNVITLLSISDDAGGAIATLAKGGAVTLALGGLGIGIGIFGAGSTVAGVTQSLNKTMGTTDWAVVVHDNVITLLSISDDAGGNIKLLKDGGSVILALGGLGLAIGWFGITSTVAGLGQALNKTMGVTDWAETIKANVLTLLSISKDAGGNIALLATGGSVALALGGLGLALGFFGAGSTVAGLADALNKTMGVSDWAVKVKDNVLTLLSIATEHGGALEVLKDGFGVSLALMGLGTAIGYFALTSSVAGLGQALNKTMGTEDWAETVKQNVLTLLSISTESGGSLALLATGGAVVLALLGLGAGVAAFGAASAVAGLAEALNKTMGVEAWAETVKTNVLTLLGIAEAAGGSLALLASGGAVTLALLGLGAGVAVFGAGSGVAGLAEALNKTMGVDAWAETVKKNVLTLLSIPDAAGGKLDTLLAAGALTLALTGLGVGLAVFGVGTALLAALTSFETADWAATIKTNVLTLLSIPSEAGGSLATMAAAGTLVLALSGLAAGIAIFGGGQAIAGLADGLTEMANAEWATNIKKNVLTLLSIPSAHGGKLDTMAAAGALVLALTGLSVGLAIFGVGTALLAALTSFETADWANSIKDNVLTLLSIPKEAGGNLEMLKDGGAVVLALTGLGIGLGIFGAGAGLSAFATLTEGEGSFAQGIKDEVLTLLSIVDEGAMEEGQVLKFTAAMAGISAGLLLFTGSKFLDSLAGAAAGLLNFLSGNESPVQAVLKLADNVDELERVGSALQSISKGLGTFAGLKGIGDVDIKEMTENLKESLPDLEKAIMGGHVDTKGWGGVDIKGLASPDIKYQEAAANLNAMMQSVSGALPTMVKGAGGAVQPGAEATAQMIDSMTIRTAIIESAIIQGPIAGAIGPTPGGGATVNNNTVTVSPSSVNSISSSSITEATYGTSDPYTGGISSGRFD